MYIYVSHESGGFYAREEYQDFDSLYCEICGESDDYVGYAETKKEARRVLKGYIFADCYENSYIEEVLNKLFEVIARALS